MGCKIGWRAIISSDRLNDAYMVEIGNQSIIGSKVLITAHIAEKDNLILAPVKIGEKCLIGVGSQINPGCEIGDGAVIASRAVLPKYTKVPPGEIWGGIPAKLIQNSTDNNK
jgi:acetyltransferase-like isoleucine patch superfamily enzyme